jgi:hypothetical protein
MQTTARTVTLVSVTAGGSHGGHTVVISDGVHTITVRGVGPYAASMVVGYTPEQLGELYTQYDSIVDSAEQVDKAAV